MPGLSRVENQLSKAEIHCFYRNGSWFVLDIARMLVFDLSPLEVEILALPDEETALLSSNNLKMTRHYPPAELEQALRCLKKNKLLKYPSQPSPVAKRETSPGISTLQLNIAQDCNLCCQYCCVKQGSFGARRGMMSLEVALAAVDFLLNESKDSQTISLTFLGGEPFLNFPIMKSVVKYAQVKAESREKKVKFVVATNGTLFNKEIISFVKENEIEVQVSLDGDKKTHDRMRVFPNGRGSYDIVRQWLPQLLADYGEKVRLRATLAPQTANFVSSFKHLRGWAAGNVTVRHAAGTRAESGLTNSDCEHLKHSYSRLAELFLEEALRDETSAKGTFLGYILRLCTGRRRSHFCGAATSMLGVSVRGKLYPCGDLAEVESCELGSVWESADWGKINYWRERLGDVDFIPACQNCWARYLCAGGCISQAFRINANPWQPDPLECEFERHIIELSVWLYAELRRRNPKVFLQLLPVKLTEVSK